MKGHANEPIGRWLNVTLDGVPQRLCLSADEETGEIEQYAIDPKTGGFMVDPQAPGHALIEKKYGKVVISLRNDAPQFIVDQYQQQRT